MFRNVGPCADDAFFPGVDKIKYEGPTSLNVLAFKHYNAEEVVLGKVRCSGVFACGVRFMPKSAFSWVCDVFLRRK